MIKITYFDFIIYYSVFIKVSHGIIIKYLSFWKLVNLSWENSIQHISKLNVFLIILIRRLIVRLVPKSFQHLIIFFVFFIVQKSFPLFVPHHGHHLTRITVVFARQKLLHLLACLKAFIVLFCFRKFLHFLRQFPILFSRFHASFDWICLWALFFEFLNSFLIDFCLFFL